MIGSLTPTGTPERSQASRVHATTLKPGGRPLRAWPSRSRAEGFTVLLGVLGAAVVAFIADRYAPQNTMYRPRPHIKALHVVLGQSCGSRVGSGFGSPNRRQQASVAAQRVERFPVEQAQQNTVAGRGARVLTVRVPEDDPQQCRP